MNSTVQIYDDNDRIMPWYQAKEAFRLANSLNLIQITEESKKAWAHAITLGYNILKEDYEAKRFNPSFTVDYKKYFYGYTNECLTRCYKQFIDYETIHQFLTLYDSIINKHCSTKLCHRCGDYYNDCYCEDHYERYTYRLLKDSW